jgi:opacity protein-like surface antigen
MKKIVLLSLMVIFVFASTSVYAAEKYALGMGNVALKVDYIYFTQDVFDKIDLKDSVYVGLEGYYPLTPNLYLGLEAGWAAPKNDGKIEDINVDIDVTYVPVELNLKYAVEVAPAWVIDFGAGASYNYFKIEANHLDANIDDWVFGGQVFADIKYKINDKLFIGINGKYQMTEDLSFDVHGYDIDTKTSADNWRAGVQIGYMF